MTDIRLQPGPQTVAARSEATVVCFGGAAGGGKTRLVVHQMALGYTEPSYSAVIFRKTFPELKGPGSVWEETRAIYPLLGGEPRESTLRWHFESGAGIQLSHLQHAKDVHRWQGKNLSAVAFEEATHFSDPEFWYLFSRLRNVTGIPVKFYLTCNPDPDAWLISPETTPPAERNRFLDWYIGEDGFPIESRSGVVRWFVRRDGRLQWFPSRAAALDAGFTDATSFTFVSSRLWDNQILMDADPSYRSRLEALPEVERAQLLMGNWRVRAKAGDYFQEAWFPRLEPGDLERKGCGQPRNSDIARWFITCDLASTPYAGDQVMGCPVYTRAESDGDPDWTRIGRWAQFKDGRIALYRMWSARDAPGAIEWLLCQVAKESPRGTTVVMWKDPAQAGDHQIATYTRVLRGLGCKLAVTQPIGPQLAATLASREAHKGRIFVQKGMQGERAFFAELQGYPRAPHDDIVSMVALANMFVNENKSRKISKTHTIPDQPGQTRNDVQTTSRFRYLL